MRITQAVVTGRRHRLFQQNGQDFAGAGQAAPGYAYGLIADGCGGKYRENGGARASQNEVGAALLGAFASHWLMRALPTVETAAELDKMIGALANAAFDFLDLLDRGQPWPAPAARRAFIATHLLTTVVGFVVTPTAARFFWRGDGLLVWNGFTQRLDEADRPDYLAYELLAAKPAPAFQTRRLPRAELRWLGVASDGWTPEALSAQKQWQSPLALQRWLNQAARANGCFEDDGAVALAYLTEAAEAAVEPATPTANNCADVPAVSSQALVPAADWPAAGHGGDHAQSIHK